MKKILTDSSELTTHTMPLTHMTQSHSVLAHSARLFSLCWTYTKTHMHAHRDSYNKYARLNTTAKLFHYFLSHTHAHFSFSPNAQIKVIFLKIEIQYLCNISIQLVIKQI